MRDRESRERLRLDMFSSMAGRWLGGDVGGCSWFRELAPRSRKKPCGPMEGLRMQEMGRVCTVLIDAESQGEAEKRERKRGGLGMLEKWNKG